MKVVTGIKVSDFQALRLSDTDHLAATHKYNRHNGKYHDCLSLLKGLCGLLHRLASFENAGLLLFESKQILQLQNVSKPPEPTMPSPVLTALEVFLAAPFSALSSDIRP
jgi:hypothetical protein